MKPRLSGNLILSGTTVLLLSLCFPPVDFSRAAFVCLAPWLVLILREKQRPAMLYSWGVGLLFFLINLSWLRHVTCSAWFALVLYLSFFFLIFGTATRFICRNSCLPMTLAAPVGWVGQEYLRSFMLTGFPWFFIGHTQYKNLVEIQIADLTGVYGISFIVVTVNACIADATLLGGRRRNMKRIGALAAWTVLLVGVEWCYGAYRQGQYSPLAGPRICVVQGDIPQSLKMKTDLESCRETLHSYQAISLEAEGQEIDLVVWPETMVPGYFNLAEHLDRLGEGDFTTLAREALASMKLLNQRLGAPLLVGGQAYLFDRDEPVFCNSAFYFDAQYFERHGTFLGRYDKVHLVPFGEYVPLTGCLPFLKGILSMLAGYVPDFSAGEGMKIFRVGSERFGVLICYEDTIAPLVRKFRYREGEIGADFLLNISNDGWFSGSAELDQHLAVCVFRAVENRVGIARAVNTGISGFIAPNGHIEGMIEKNGKRRQVTGTLVRAISVDNRVTFYTVYGDLFARLCLVTWVGAIGYCAIARQKRMKKSPEKP